MSRIGRKEIIVPAGVTASINNNVVTVKGPNGELTQEVDKLITVNIADGKITLARANEENKTKAKHGLYRALTANMVKGVTEGFKTTLIVNGVNLITLPSTAGVITVSYANVKVPLGPLTVISFPALSLTSTPCGITIGILPILDI